ncbi:5'/3'-nucleotidase SurE [Kineococcus glutinatus]|uniref:5'-nucleotidase n=1 Tax=Kineococcus glutinatus TaxID=1070872 RepID=A0ABP9H8G6_9ACTN
MRVLVTNDDGVDSPGVHALARVARDGGHQVVLAAPHTERSGASASLTVLADDGRLVVHERRVEGLEGVRVLAVEATPGFIAFTAGRGAFGEPPELVLSGINRGPNTGYAILHSGTVGAALTAATQGIAGLAVSLDTERREPHWETAAQVAARALAWFAPLAATGAATPPGGHPPVLNVNVPDVPPEELRGLRAAELARVGAVQAVVGEVGEGYVTVTFDTPPLPDEPDGDAVLVRRGWATATLVRVPSRAAGDLTGLVDG